MDIWRICGWIFEGYAGVSGGYVDMQMDFCKICGWIFAGYADGYAGVRRGDQTTTDGRKTM